MSLIVNSVICEELFVQNNFNEINLYNIAGCTSNCLKNEKTMVRLIYFLFNFFYIIFFSTEF